MTSDDAFMMLAGVRYCLGRHSYAGSLCCHWLKAKWPDVREQDRRQILREIGEHIAGGEEGRWHNVQAGCESDLRTWQAFRAWAVNADAEAPRCTAPATGRTADENELREALATELALVIYGGGMISPLAFATRLLSGPLAQTLQEAATLRARLQEAERALTTACRMDAILLMAGEMTAQERRTAQAVTNGLAAKVRAALATPVPQTQEAGDAVL